MLHSLYDNSCYVFNALTPQTLAVALGLFVLGIYALIREQGSHVSVVIFVLMLSMGVWLFAFTWMNCAIDDDLAMWWAKLAYVGITAIPAAVYNFSTLMFKDYEKGRKRVLAIWIFSFLYAVVILTTNIQFSSLYRYSWGFYPRSGVASIPFILYFFGIMVVSLRVFVVAYRGAIAGSAQQTRARELLIIFSIGYLSATDFLISFGFPWYPLGYIPVFLFIVLSARSIRHSRFMNITLALAARQIVEYHGGRIWAESTQGKGSVFTFTLPLAGKRGAEYRSYTYRPRLSRAVSRINVVSITRLLIIHREHISKVIKKLKIFFVPYVYFVVKKDFLRVRQLVSFSKMRQIFSCVSVWGCRAQH